MYVSSSRSGAAETLAQVTQKHPDLIAPVRQSARRIEARLGWRGGRIPG